MDAKFYCSKLSTYVTIRRGRLRVELPCCLLLSLRRRSCTARAIGPAARMAFELPPRLRLEHERRAEKAPKASSSSVSGSTKKGMVTAALCSVGADMEGGSNFERFSHAPYRSALDERRAPAISCGSEKAWAVELERNFSVFCPNPHAHTGEATVKHSLSTARKLARRHTHQLQSWFARIMHC